MNSENSSDIDSINVIFGKILDLEPWLDKINTAHIPFVSGLSLLKTDVSTSLKLSF